MARFAVGFVLVTVIGWLTYVTLFFPAGGSYAGGVLDL